MKRISFFSLALLAILLAGCAPAIARSTMEYAGAPDVAPQAEVLPQEYAMADEGSSIVDSTNVAAADRVVIKNASMSVVVDDPAALVEQIGQMAEESGGFIVSSNLARVQTSQGIEVPRADITVRVPAEQLTSTMDAIKSALADPEKDLLSENISGQDVTSEYTDLQSRLKNLEEARKGLEAIMDNANETEDVLAVYNELTQVTEQIEVLQGKIQYYNEAARLSALSVTISATESIRELSIGGWQPRGIARNAIQALIDTLQFLASAAIWIGLYVIPVGLCILIPIFLVYLVVRSIVRRRKARKQTVVENAETPPTA